MKLNKSLVALVLGSTLSIAPAQKPNYEAIVKKVVAEHNERLQPTNPLDYHLVLGMIETETGGSQKAYEKDPMQIANTGDYALETLNQKRVGLTNLDRTKVQTLGTKLGDASFAYLKDNRTTPRKNGAWDYTNQTLTPEESIRGGVSWLCYNAAQFGYATHVQEAVVVSYVVQEKDTLERIAKKSGSTTQVIQKYNPQIKPESLQIGTKLTFPKAERVLTITGWDSWEKAIEEYNGGGDKNYLTKVKKNAEQKK